MMALLLWASLSVQDINQQINEFLRQFQAAQQVEEGLNVLADQLIGLGSSAVDPIARRLAEDLRDGMSTAAVPAMIDALVGRPEALVPLQSAFRDAATNAAGRIELASALNQLDDMATWRDSLAGILADPSTDLSDRLRAAEVLIEAGDARVAPELARIVEGPLSETDRRRVREFLARAGTPETRALSSRLPYESAEDPRVELIDDPPVRASGSVPPPARKKEPRRDGFMTVPNLIAGGITLVLLVALLAMRRRIS